MKGVHVTLKGKTIVEWLNGMVRCQHGFRPGTCAECERQSREAVGDYLHEKAEGERAERLRLRREITDRRPDLDGLP